MYQKLSWKQIVEFNISAFRLGSTTMTTEITGVVGGRRVGEVRGPGEGGGEGG